MHCFDRKKAIERNKLKKDMESMSMKELIALGDCDHKCPKHRPNGCGCAGCDSLGENGCKKPRESRERECLVFLCNPFMKVAGVNYG